MSTPDAAARGLLGDSAPPAGAPLDALIEALTAAVPDDLWRAKACERFEADLAAIRRAAERQRGLYAEIDAAIGRLREITSPGTLLAAIAHELCHSSPLSRIVVSSVVHGVMTAETVVDRDDPQAGERALRALRENPVRLAHPLVEADVLRRAQAALVTGARANSRVHQPLAQIMDWDSYVATVIATRGRVAAMIHADCGGDEPVREEHRVLLDVFARGASQAYERASLRRKLRLERQEIRRMLRWLDSRSSELADTAIALDPRTSTAPLLGGDDSSPASAPLGAQALDGLLTRREQEVLRLLSEGLSNRAIADELVLSTGTVKFHVNRILSKLRVANRAEAVARYYSLMSLKPPA